MDVTVTTAMKDKKQIIAISKMLQDNASSPNPEAYAGFKFHNETSYEGGHFLAVRCKQPTASCAKLPIDPTQGKDRNLLNFLIGVMKIGVQLELTSNFLESTLHLVAMIQKK